MEQAMHAARLAAAYDALLALLTEFNSDGGRGADAICVNLSITDGLAHGFDVMLTLNDMPVGGEGL